MFLSEQACMGHTPCRVVGKGHVFLFRACIKDRMMSLLQQNACPQTSTHSRCAVCSGMGMPQNESQFSQVSKPSQMPFYFTYHERDERVRGEGEGLLSNSKSLPLPGDTAHRPAVHLAPPECSAAVQ